ncbi:hypothetical protein MBM09_12680 [Flaviramulus sp. BrNp1-15]|nr:hypothetical protein [Flaviramulus sp. BrNp1-15]ULC58764.1 hypothetical protein MBM09_12680 [Flaviramulus sp. BrNp1-15]
MSPHFCKVGKIKPNLNKLISLKELENKIANFVEDASKVEFSEEFETTSI